MSAFIHADALVDEGARIGDHSRVWAFAHIQGGAIIGDTCNIGDGTFIETGAKIGNRVTVKNQVLIWDGVTIGDDVFIGPAVCFTNDRFPRSPRMECVHSKYRHPENWLEKTVVETGASIGAKALILCGIQLGRYCMVAAGSTVTKDVPPFRLVMGSPAKEVGWVTSDGKPLQEISNGLFREADSGKEYFLNEMNEPIERS